MDGGRAVLGGLIGRTGAGRAVDGPEVGGRDGAVPVDTVETSADTLPDAVGRTGGGRAIEGGAFGIRAATVLVSFARGTTRFGFGGSMLDDVGDDSIVMGRRALLALNGVFVSDDPAFDFLASAFFGEVPFTSVGRPLALASSFAAASDASCSAFSSASRSRLR